MSRRYEAQRGLRRWKRGAGGVGRSRAVELLARVGYLTKGVVYAIIGVLAMKVALGTGGGQLTDGEGAVRQIGTQPFGALLLILAGSGLAGYALWRFVQAVVDADHNGSDAKGVAKRVGYAISGVIHGSLALLAFQLASGDGGGRGSKQTWLGQLLALPAGKWIIVAIGAGVAGFAIHQIAQAVRASFMRKLKTGELGYRGQTWVRRLGRLGLASRGVVFVVIGWFLIRAGLRESPGQAGGVGEALGTLASQPYGVLLLAVVALGLLAYAVYMAVNARYRRIPA